MSKERLEEMNKKVTGLTDSDGDFADAVKMDVDTYAWFYEQAERVQELEDYNTRLLNKRQQEHAELDGLNKQNKHYREALESISNGPGQVGCLESFAREVLEGSPHDI